MAFLPPSARARQLIASAREDRMKQAEYAKKLAAEKEAADAVADVAVVEVTVEAPPVAVIEETLKKALQPFVGVPLTSETLASIEDTLVGAVETLTVEPPEATKEEPTVVDPNDADPEKPGVQAITKSSLDRLTKAKLTALAEARELVVPEGATKAEIVALILASVV